MDQDQNSENLATAMAMAWVSVESGVEAQSLSMWGRHAFYGLEGGREGEGGGGGGREERLKDKRRREESERIRAGCWVVDGGWFQFSSEELDQAVQVLLGPRSSSRPRPSPCPCPCPSQHCIL